MTDTGMLSLLILLLGKVIVSFICAALMTLLAVPVYFVPSVVSSELWERPCQKFLLELWWFIVFLSLIIITSCEKNFNQRLPSGLTLPGKHILFSISYPQLRCDSPRDGSKWDRCDLKFPTKSPERSIAITHRDFTVIWPLWLIYLVYFLCDTYVALKQNIIIITLPIILIRFDCYTITKNGCLGLGSLFYLLGVGGWTNHGLHALLLFRHVFFLV